MDRKQSFRNEQTPANSSSLVAARKTISSSMTCCGRTPTSAQHLSIRLGPSRRPRANWRLPPTISCCSNTSLRKAKLLKSRDKTVPFLFPERVDERPLPKIIECWAYEYVSRAKLNRCILVITDRLGTIEYANPAFETVTGYSGRSHWANAAYLEIGRARRRLGGPRTSGTFGARSGQSEARSGPTGASRHESGGKCARCNAMWGQTHY